MESRIHERIRTLDRRFPMFLGFWTRSIPYVHKTPAIDTTDEPHLKRKIIISEKYPDILSLNGADITTLYITLILVTVQIISASISYNLEWSLYFLLAFFVGGTVTAVNGVIIHEATHDLIIPSHSSYNKIAGLIANIPIPVPVAISFRRYHLDHHTYQGVIGKDPDIPMPIEYQMIHGNPFLKLLWICMYPMLYVVRGLYIFKKPSLWEFVNSATVLLTDFLIIRYLGWESMRYLILSTWIGYSVHPISAHFIQEHFTWSDKQETYSYYGILNKIALNIGYHNEHHDFSQIPWSKLPTIKAIAEEFYVPLEFHHSWLLVFWRFVTDRTMGPQSRVLRDVESHRAGRQIVFAQQ